MYSPVVAVHKQAVTRSGIEFLQTIFSVISTVTFTSLGDKAPVRHPWGTEKHLLNALNNCDVILENREVAFSTAISMLPSFS